MERIDMAEAAEDARLHVEAEPEDGPVITSRGELDYATRHRLQTVIESFFAQDIYNFALDLSALDFIDSSGLGLLIMTRRRIDNHTGRMPVVLNDRTERILTTMQLLDFFERCATREEARELVRSLPVA